MCWRARVVAGGLADREPFAQVGPGFDVSTTTCWRHVNETIELLAARAPKLRVALCKARRDGMAYVIIDGTLVPVDRIAADRPFYSGEHKGHGVNLQVIASPDGTILWVSGQLPAARTTSRPPASGRFLVGELDRVGCAAGGMDGEQRGRHGHDEGDTDHDRAPHAVTTREGRQAVRSF